MAENKGRLPLDNSMTDEFADTDRGASATQPGKKAEDRRAELRQTEVLEQNVQMRHKPTGEVTTYNRDQLKGAKLFVPALRDEFPLDQFEEYKERG